MVHHMRRNTAISYCALRAHESTGLNESWRFHDAWRNGVSKVLTLPGYCPVAAKRNPTIGLEPPSQYMINISRFIHSHPHPLLLISAMLGVGFGLLLPGQWRLVTQVLVGWNIMVWFYLSWMGWLMLLTDHTRLLKIAIQEDEHGATILALFSIATIASLVAIVLELTNKNHVLSAQQLTTGFHLFKYLLTGATILGSWFFAGVLFTFHYSRMYCLSPANSRPLKFPDEGLDPDYWDFLYFSFTIAVAVQTADVSIMSRSMRKIVLVQSAILIMTKTYPIPDLGGRTIRLTGVLAQPSSIKSSKCSQLSKHKYVVSAFISSNKRLRDGSI